MALFSSTVRENIGSGHSATRYDMIVNAEQKAQADAFNPVLNGEYDAMVGEKSLRLSDDQRQRIAVARDILWSPRLLLRDEATSALDLQPKPAVQNAPENLMKNRTSFVIAHRLATVALADRILVMDCGRMQVIGTH